MNVGRPLSVLLVSRVSHPNPRGSDKPHPHPNTTVPPLVHGGKSPIPKDNSSILIITLTPGVPFVAPRRFEATLLPQAHHTLRPVGTCPADQSNGTWTKIKQVVLTNTRSFSWVAVRFTRERQPFPHVSGRLPTPIGGDLESSWPFDCNSFSFWRDCCCEASEKLSFGFTPSHLHTKCDFSFENMGPMFRHGNGPQVTQVMTPRFFQPNVFVTCNKNVVRLVFVLRVHV